MDKNIEEYETVQYWIKYFGDAYYVRDYLRELHNFCDWLGKDPDTMISERREQLKSEDIKIRTTYEEKGKDYLNYLLQQGKAPKTAFKTLAIIRSFFTHNRYSLNYTRKELKTPEPMYQDYVPTREDVKVMCNHASPKVKAIILTAFQSGLRVSDVAKLDYKWLKDKVEKEQPPIPLEIKTKKERVIARTFLGKDAVEALKVYFKTRGDAKGAVFKQEYQSRDMNELNLCKAVQEVAKKADIGNHGERFRIHNLRKAFKNALDEAKVNADWIDVIMGHKLPGSRGAYTSPSIASLREAYKQAEPYLSIGSRSGDQLTAEVEDLKKLVGSKEVQINSLTLQIQTLSDKLSKVEHEAKKLALYSDIMTLRSCIDWENLDHDAFVKWTKVLEKKEEEFRQLPLTEEEQKFYEAMKQAKKA